MLRRITTALAATLIAGTAFADVATLVKDCEGCHGTNGASQWTDMPTIAGISKTVHADYLTAYQNKERPCTKSKFRQGDTKRPETDMCAVTAKLSEADIQGLAAHFAAKPFVAAKQAVDAAKATAGAAIHKKDCEKCHTEGGKVADDDASILTGQQLGYLKKAMEEFNSGKRPQEKNMKKKMDALKPADLEALANFYASGK